MCVCMRMPACVCLSVRVCARSGDSVSMGWGGYLHVTCVSVNAAVCLSSKSLFKHFVVFKFYFRACFILFIQMPF